eukprot:2694378-Alexandrium_andersonii.AAC.1
MGIARLRAGPSVSSKGLEPVRCAMRTRVQPLTWWRCSFTVWRKVSAHVKRKCTCAIMQGAFRRLVYVSQHATTCPRQTDLRHLCRYRSGPNTCVGKGDSVSYTHLRAHETSAHL